MPQAHALHAEHVPMGETSVTFIPVPLDWRHQVVCGERISDRLLNLG
jgi:hypothetical protein